ncbi:MAG: hypothetical protein QF632_03320 [Candidatus Woesearchaeota archaeon]|nr:hypothetical protein [Candidatus Woesearchaeota archaeon]
MCWCSMGVLMVIDGCMCFRHEMHKYFGLFLVLMLLTDFPIGNIRYILYPEAIATLEGNGIARRVRNTLSEVGKFLRNFVRPNIMHCRQDIKELEEEVFFYSKLIAAERDELLSGVREIIRTPRLLKWDVERTHGTFGTLEMSQLQRYEEISMLAGFHASHIIFPNELAAYRNFGFESVSAFAGAVGAYIDQSLRSKQGLGYVWETKLEDGRTWLNSMQPSDDQDFEVGQLDVSSYETKDPLGKEVLYRPKRSHDSRGFRYERGEGPFLSLMLKYTFHVMAESAVLADHGRALIEEVKEHREGNLGKEDMGYEGVSSNFLDEFPRVDGDYRPLDEVKEWYHTFNVWMGQENELVIGGVEDGRVVPRAVFYPQDVDHALRGLFIGMTCTGIPGRTSPAQLIKVMEYRFSEQFREDVLTVD